MPDLPEFSTPMMQQYACIKKKYEDCLLLFRLGDFYELFMEDAKIGSKVLDIVLTARPRGQDGDIPMAGVPYHALDSYLSKLVKAGYKVAICEQVSDPSNKGIIEREVVRVVTPGTLLDEKSLDAKRNNHIICIDIKENILGMAVADLSTGAFLVTEKEFENSHQAINNEISRLNPSECILPEYLYNDPKTLGILSSFKGLNIFPFFEWDNYIQSPDSYLKKHFKVSTLSAFGILDESFATRPAAGLLGYLSETQNGNISHFKKIEKVSDKETMDLDRSTIFNLELFSTIREGGTRGTLLDVLDYTHTAMGARLLKRWLSKPLTNTKRIKDRLNAVDELVSCSEVKQKKELLKEIYDIERLLSRLSVGIGNACDLVNLKKSLKTVLILKKHLDALEASYFGMLSKDISTKLKKVIQLIDKNIVDSPPIDLKQGGLIKGGVDSELEGLRNSIKESRNWIETLEEAEQKRTGISSLKVRFNKVFGYYIEVSNPNLHLVPDHYMRKQTMVNAERFMTVELKEKEEIVLIAEEKINKLEYEIFLDILGRVLEEAEIIQQAAYAVAKFDCVLSFSTLSHEKDYVKPEIVNSGELEIKDGRHPVVETLLIDSQFVPNDTFLNHKKNQLLVITGPNMSGKSVYIRQVALIVLLAQAGCFVPASQAKLPVVDNLFVRSGASDFITSGLSTFMVEMVETANILNNATEKSLVVLDEIGRGTSTYDGVSIAMSVARYLVEKVGAKTLFATHYHELQVLEQEYDQVKNYQVAVKENNGEPIFLYRVLEGGASHSYGVSVAKMAGIPDKVVSDAEQTLEELERWGGDSNKKVSKKSSGREKTKTVGERSKVEKEIRKLDLQNMTPIEVMNKLFELQRMM